MPGQKLGGIKNTYTLNSLPGQTQDKASGASPPCQSQEKCANTPSTSGAIQVARRDNPARRAARAKRRKRDGGAKEAGYDSFPNDDFLFEEAKEESKESQSGSIIENASPSLENISSWEELEAVERSMDWRQLYTFRRAYVGIKKPKFVAQDERWVIQQVTVAKQSTCLGVLYLALLYTEQILLPVDIIRYSKAEPICTYNYTYSMAILSPRWVRLEKLPYSTPIIDSGKSPKNIQANVWQCCFTFLCAHLCVSI